MHALSRPVAVILIGSLVWMTGNNAIASPQASMQSVVRKQVELFGPGTEVKLKLISGKTLGGSIVSAGDEFFEVMSHREQPARQIPYFAVKEIEIRKAAFPASEDASIQQARRVVEGSLGGRIKVKVTSGKELQGSIFRIYGHHFELLPDGKVMTVNVAYADIRELRPRPQLAMRSSFTKKALIGVTFYVLLLINARNKPGSLP